MKGEISGKGGNHRLVAFERQEAYNRKKMDDLTRGRKAWSGPLSRNLKGVARNSILKYRGGGPVSPLGRRIKDTEQGRGGQEESIISNQLVLDRTALERSN